ncbi:lactonase family protein [Rubripirellula sp.]|nr:lactonase family protein [Rubripirellula sp.]
MPCSKAARNANKISLPLLTLLALATSLVSTSSYADDRTTGRIQRVYIGTYTGPKSQGIYVAELDSKTGKLTQPRLAAEMVSPSWVTIHPNQKLLYAAGESASYPDGGSIAAFRINADGSLAAINSVAPNGSGPCHLAIDSTGTTMLISNYGSGNLASVKLNPDGTIESSTWSDQYPTLVNNQKPHAHHATFTHDNQFAVACDAGLDRICVYRHDAKNASLMINDPAFVETAKESHPRHLTFSNDGRYCYAINEKAMSVTVFSFDTANGQLNEIQTISTLPNDYEGTIGSTAELIMHPNGKFLYGSNRGPDNLVCYSVDPANGTLSLAGHTATGGQTARSFGIDATGHWMLIGNQNSDSIVQFKINQRTGTLTPTGTTYELGSPVCFQFRSTDLNAKSIR